MNLNKVPAGNHIPEDIYVIIEIPSNSDPIKYEIQKDTGIIFVDRFISTPMFYPCNYGYINHTLAEDEDPIDVLVLTSYPLLVGCVIHCRPIGMLDMLDESGEDFKIIAVPNDKISQEYIHIQDINQLSITLRNQISHFFEHYKDLDPKKWSKIKTWQNAKAAKIKIEKGFKKLINTHSKNTE